MSSITAKYTLVKNIEQEKRQNEKYSCKQATLDVYKAKLKWAVLLQTKPS